MRKSNNISNEKLHCLISSLSKQEKIDFKLSLRNTDAPSYLEVFEIFDSMEIADEKKIRKKTEAKGLTAKFSKLRNYLFYLLADKLSNRLNGVSAKLRHLMNKADFLHTKGFFAEALDEIERAKAIAKENDKNTVLLELYDKERFLRYMVFDAQVYSNFMIEYQVKTEELLKSEINFHIYAQKVMEMTLKLKTTGNLHDKRSIPLPEFKNKIFAYLEKENDKKKSPRTELQFLLMAVTVYAHLNNTKKTAETSRQLIELRNNNKLFFLNYPYYESMVLMNTIRYYLSAKKYDAAFESFDELKLVVLTSADISLRRNGMYFYISEKMLAKLKAGQHANNKQLEEEVKAYYTSQKPLSPEISCLALASLFFRNKEYSKCLYWINIILNDIESPKTFIKCITEMLLLMVHFEKENFELLESIIGRINRNYLSEPPSFSNLLVLAKFISLLLSDKNRKKKNALRELAQTVHNNKEADEEVYDYFDVYEWMLAKI